MNPESPAENQPRPSWDLLDRVLARFTDRLPAEERRYLLLVPLIGVLAGLVAVGLEKLLGLFQLLFWGSVETAAGAHPSVREAARELSHSRPWLLPLILGSGGAIVAVAFLFLRSEKRFEGTAGLIESLALKKGRLPFIGTLIQSVVSIAAVGAGASLGREGPMLHSGAAVGSWLGRRFRLEDHHVKMLLACGAAAGMAAAYNAPIGASIFVMEVLLPSFALELFGPILICSVLSTTIAHAVFGSEPVYSIPKYEILSHWELLLDMGLGVLLGLVSVVFIRVFSGANLLLGWLKPIRHWKPVVAMLILGLVGIPYFDLFGNGYDTVNLVLNGEHVGGLQLLVLLAVLKIFVTALCRAGGIPGGLFTPSLFIGALLGNCFGVLAHHTFSSCRLSDPAAFALVGMGAIVAGTLQSPVTAILLIFEMTREYALILPLMSACILSALVSRWFQKGSLFTEPLRRGGIVLPKANAPTWLRQPVVRAFLSPDVASVSPAERFQRLTDTFLRAPEGQDELYVTNPDGRCLGVISLHDIKRFIRETDHLESVIAADILNPSFPFVYADEPISRAIELLAESDRERLPVLESAANRKLLGTVSKRKLLWDYSETSLARDRLEKEESP